jgi:flagellar motor switch/type III secretory pathway protein FliN
LTATVRSWLPAGIADRADVRSALSGEVENWASVWFAGPRLGAIDFGRRQSSVGGGAAVAIEAPDLLQLAALAAEISDPVEALSGADRSLLRGLGEEMLVDLRRRLEALLDPPAQGSGVGPALEMRLGPKGLRPSLRIVLAEEVLVGLIKQIIGRATRAAEPLASIASALTETSLTIDVNLGKVDLTLGDLRGLAKGDVLVLDTPLDGTISLSLSGARAVFATARLSQTGDDMTLTVSR